MLHGGTFEWLKMSDFDYLLLCITSHLRKSSGRHEDTVCPRKSRKLPLLKVPGPTGNRTRHPQHGQLVILNTFMRVDLDICHLHSYQSLFAGKSNRKSQ